MESGGRLNFNSVYLFYELKLHCHSRRDTFVYGAEGRPTAADAIGAGGEYRTI